ncbi:hypothetical protein diail_3500 [Diaporthe ilicicola]|nr:hypothetical protein diail_3500 [Diaporthe ilicicola]
MSSSSSALPTPRQLLTSILNSISQIPAPQAPAAGAEKAQGSSTITGTDSFTERAREPATNPLKLLDPRHRPLFTTLHVLFPSLLLPALDLLDRGLVTRLVGEHEYEDGGSVGMRDPTTAPPPPSSSSVYLVRSAQKPARRPYGGGGGGDPSTASASTTTTTTTTTTSGSGSGSGSSQRTYVVHTAAWNCTCAAFAFSAFPPLAAAPSLLLAPTRGARPQADEAHPVPAIAMAADVKGDAGEDGADGRAEWHFGGVSFDGTGADANGAGGLPPCCKHLLACVLVERWVGGLGSYVTRRVVAREEIAGVFADV